MIFKKKFSLTWLVMALAVLTLCLDYNNLSAAQKVLVINDDAVKTNSVNVVLTITPNLSETPSQMMISNTSGFEGRDWETYAPTKNWTITSGDGTKKVYIKFVYGSKTSTYSYDSIILDTVKPTGTLKINSGAASTNNPDVKLSISASTDTYKMQVSNTPSFSGDWEKYTTSKSWTLTSGSGQKTVYVRFKDQAENISDSVPANITLDTSGPDAGSITINNGLPDTNNKSVTLTITAQDAVKMLISNDSNFTSGSWAEYAPTTNWTLNGIDGEKTVYIKFKDSNGNISQAYSDSIILNTKLVTGKVVINDNDEFANSSDVTLTIEAPADTQEVMISNNSKFLEAEWQTYSGQTTWSWILTNGIGNKKVYVRFKDHLGNISKYCFDTIKYTNAVPTGKIDINSGKASTTSDDVTLKIYASSGVKEMIISNNASFSGAQWETYFTSKQWTLSNNPLVGDDDGDIKIVYIKFRDAAGNKSAVYADVITVIK